MQYEDPCRYKVAPHETAYLPCVVADPLGNYVTGQRMFQAGEEVEYFGRPSSNLIPLCKEGKKRQAEFLAERAAKEADAKARSVGGMGSDQIAQIVAAVAASSKQPVMDMDAMAELVAAKMLAAKEAESVKPTRGKAT